MYWSKSEPLHPATRNELRQMVKLHGAQKLKREIAAIEAELANEYYANIDAMAARHATDK